MKSARSRAASSLRPRCMQFAFALFVCFVRFLARAFNVVFFLLDSAQSTVRRDARKTRQVEFPTSAQFGVFFRFCVTKREEKEL